MVSETNQVKSSINKYLLKTWEALDVFMMTRASGVTCSLSQH